MWNASVILLQVGFRDDTSYLAAHYGGGRTPRSIAQTAAASEASTLRDARNLYQQQDKCRISSTTLGVSRPSPNAISSSSAPRCGRIPTPPSGLADRNRHSSSIARNRAEQRPQLLVQKHYCYKVHDTTQASRILGQIEL